MGILHITVFIKYLAAVATHLRRKEIHAYPHLDDLSDPRQVSEEIPTALDYNLSDFLET